jgi:hypothetical protein
MEMEANAVTSFATFSRFRIRRGSSDRGPGVTSFHRWHPTHPQKKDAEADGKPAKDQLVDKVAVAWPSDAVRVPTEVVGADGSYSKRLDLA